MCGRPPSRAAALTGSESQAGVCVCRSYLGGRRVAAGPDSFSRWEGGRVAGGRRGMIVFAASLRTTMPACVDHARMRRSGRQLRLASSCAGVSSQASLRGEGFEVTDIHEWASF